MRPLLVLVVLLVASCSSGTPDQPAAVPFTAVDLPVGASPVVLAAAGGELLIGVRRAGQPVVPGLLRRAANGAVTEGMIEPASEYGRLATWTSITADEDRTVAIGGERGGAHGHVRWSVWSGSADRIVEQRQGFSVFGGYEIGELIDAVLTPVGPIVVGSWQSARVGFDVAVWTTDGQVWTRQNSAGTALESSTESMGFPTAATALEPGILVAGWQLALDAGRRQAPVVWRSSSGTSGWTRTPLPEAGQAGAAMAARCWGQVCGVVGRVDGMLALWRLADGSWTRLAGVPPIAVGDQDSVAAPFEVDGRLTQAMSDGGQVKIATFGGDGWTVRPAAGPTGTVSAAVVAGDALYLLAGQTLWRTDLALLR